MDATEQQALVSLTSGSNYALRIPGLGEAGLVLEIDPGFEFIGYLLTNGIATVNLGANNTVTLSFDEEGYLHLEISYSGHLQMVIKQRTSSPLRNHMQAALEAAKAAMDPALVERNQKLSELLRMIDEVRIDKCQSLDKAISDIRTLLATIKWYHKGHDAQVIRILLDDIELRQKEIRILFPKTKPVDNLSISDRIDSVGRHLRDVRLRLLEIHHYLVDPTDEERLEF